MFYWTLGNIHPKYRSNLNATQLHAITKLSHVEKHGFRSIFQRFISDIKTLKNEGISVPVENENILFRGSLIFVAGDTPASAAMGEFKESVAAFRFCRNCMTTQNDWKNDFNQT